MMIAFRRIMTAMALLGASAGAASAADGLLGLQFGAGVGQADIRIDQRPGNIALGLKDNHSAWQAFIGVRPISLLGAELAYFDLGTANSTLGTVQARARQHGTSLMAVGYLPLPVPLLDIYGKAGFARTQTTLDGSVSGVNCVVAGCNVFRGNSSDTRLGWGLGTQVKLPVIGMAVRAEYVQFSTPNGDPHLVTVGVVWNP